MNSERWRFIAEMVGIAAIVVTLIVLIFEIRQTQSALVAATYQARAIQAIEHNTALQEGERMLPLLARTNLLGPDELNSLTPEERLRLKVFFTSRRIDADNEYFQYQNGLLGEEYYENSLIRQVKKSAPVWRALDVDEGRPSFSQFVDQALAE